MWESESVAVPRDVLLKEVAEADALWTVLADRIDRELLEAGNKLQIVANMAVGYNNIDLRSGEGAWCHRDEYTRRFD